MTPLSDPAVKAVAEAFGIEPERLLARDRLSDIREGVSRMEREETAFIATLVRHGALAAHREQEKVTCPRTY